MIFAARQTSPSQLTNVIAFFRLGNFVSVIEIPLLSNCRAVAYDDDDDEDYDDHDHHDDRTARIVK